MDSKTIKEHVNYIKENCDGFVNMVHAKMQELNWKWGDDKFPPTLGDIKEEFCNLLGSLKPHVHGVQCGGFYIFINDDKECIDCYFGDKCELKEGIFLSSVQPLSSEIITTTEKPDYEKLYKQALDRAKEWKSGLAGSDSMKPSDCIDDLFPELKVSKDERIRQAIVEHFKKLKEDSWIKIQIPEILSWLEKQKEREWTSEEQQMLDNIDESLFMFESGRNAAVKEQIEEERAWLKSLKPQAGMTGYDKGYRDGFSAALFNIGKPSTSQMDALRVAMNEMRKSNYDSDTNDKLDDLYSWLVEIKKK